jgi:hypothetical protein
MPQIVIPDNELNAFDLPRVCVVTGQSQNVVFKPVKFSWYPRWIGVLVLVNVLLAVIVASIMTKRVKGELPFTEEAWAAWRKGRMLMAFSVIGAIALFVGGAVLMANDLPAPGVVGLVASLVLPIVIGVKFLRNKGVTCAKIADGKTTLTIPSEEAAIAIQRHLTGAEAHVPVVATLA